MIRSVDLAIPNLIPGQRFNSRVLFCSCSSSAPCHPSPLFSFNKHLSHPHIFDQPNCTRGRRNMGPPPKRGRGAGAGGLDYISLDGLRLDGWRADPVRGVDRELRICGRTGAIGGRRQWRRPCWIAASYRASNTLSQAGGPLRKKTSLRQIPVRSNFLYFLSQSDYDSAIRRERERER